MHMRMQQKVLSPGMENADEPNMRSQSRGVGCHFEHRGRTGTEKQVIQEAGVVAAQCIQFVRQSEYNVEVGNREQFEFPRGNPPLAGLRLTLRTMTVPARVIGHRLMPASRALINMAAELCCTTARDGSQHRQVLIIQPRVLLDEPPSVCPNNIGHFDSGPSHSGFRFLLDSATGAVVRTLIFSSGFATACR